MRSRLEIFDVRANSVRTVLESDRLIEAPNWDPLGGSLLVNVEGGLRRVDLREPGLELVDSGFADACNNDHGFSPDGGLVAISHKHQGASTVYVLPATGGTPRKVTDRNPSYWHGWSPDGARLAYVGRRGDAFDIYTCAVTGGEETQLTADAGHNDGPDYSSDGQYIWFNSDRTGHAQIWRMGEDGAEPRRMVESETVDWFPHPSPDGAHVLYLAYPPGTKGHPRDRDVALMLINPEGGDSRELLRFNGGQGTINVPCWAPDGSAFAFVRYGRMT